MVGRRLFSIVTLSVLLPLCVCAGQLTRLVNPFIGTGGHGHVFLGANVPFGLVQLGPTQHNQGWYWCSGYHYSDSVLVGFSHTHLSGTGVGDLGDITVLPVVSPGQSEVRFSHEDEACRPGYYALTLANGVKVELTATERAGLHRYTCPEDADSLYLRLDLKFGVGWDKMVDGKVSVGPAPALSVSGHRFSRGWANNQKLFYVADFSKPFANCRTQGDTLAIFSFPNDGQPLLLRVGLSAVSEEGARANQRAELNHWDFDRVALEADAKWEAQLEKVKVASSGSQSSDVRSPLSVFYTALYHTMIAPSLFSDVNGDYRGADGELHHNQHQTYTTWSLWDTYRAAHPLMTLLHRDRQDDLAATMISIWREQGKLPVWHLMGCETNCMVGNPAIPVLADMVLKGLTRRGTEALEAMKASAMLDERGLKLLKQYGYIPCDLFEDQETVGRALEYALADWCVARVAERLGQKPTQHYFDERAQAYRHYFDPATGFMRGKDSKGRFSFPNGAFNPFHSAPKNRDYTEGNAWQFTWLVPHDVDGLVSLFGSESRFVGKLDSLFIVEGDLGEEAPPDITGLVGQYAHGNEPSHHILYMYNYVGQPWKGARLIRQVLSEQYRNDPDGLSGNEDVGQMSAWYVLSAMGLYQVEPAGGKYIIGSPLFDEMTVNTGNGKSFTVKAIGNSDKNIYVQRARLNGKPYTRSYVMYDDLVGGGTLELEMGPEPSDFGTRMEDRPHSDPRQFHSEAVDKKIEEVKQLLSGNAKLAQMFADCFPNTLETTVHYRQIASPSVKNGGGLDDDTFVYTGDIHAMWLRDSGAQVWPYVPLAKSDEKLRHMLRGVILRQWKCICLDPYANAFNDGPTGGEWQSDRTAMKPELHERKYEIDSSCYPIRLAYEYWRQTGDDSIFGQDWLQAVKNILRVFRTQQRKSGVGDYRFLRVTDRAFDTQGWDGYGAPVKPVGLIASAFRPSDDATVLPFLVPSNFMAVSSLRKADEILRKVNKEKELAKACSSLADEVEQALREYAVVEHPKYGKVYAYEVDGFGNALLMDDSNVPSLLAMGYLGDVPLNDPVWQNTRRFVWSDDNPCFFRGSAGEGIGGPHIGRDYVWPMSIMMKCFTAQSDEEIRHCMRMLLDTDAGTGLIHESFHKDDASRFTRPWFAWQNSLFGELVLKLLADGKQDLLNNL